MLDPAVTLSDYALTLESLILASLIARVPTAGGAGRRIRSLFFLFFLAGSLPPLLGGTFHGFVYTTGSAWTLPLWRATMISIGVVAGLGWVLGAALCLSDRWYRRVVLIAGIEVLIYASIVLALYWEFPLAIANYLPAALFLLGAFIIVTRRPGTERAGWLGAIGVGVTFVAAGVQVSGFALDPDVLNANTLYHLIQGGGLILWFLAARRVVLARSES
ncbi:MAG: hypothetical protein K9H25_12150 [Rhodospirillum sp.]|nr:hypothetical protein [Rhodospirillum sp.]MCF8490004.1 hypothetical protein [Rhodospirillum sp.]MCF8498839.1 hypothetical protein [Rhodospirillum sp.]